MQNQIVNKKLKLKLVGIDGNIYSLLGAFASQARKEGWSNEEQNKIRDAVFASNSYDEALNILASHCEGGGGEIEEDDDWDDMDDTDNDPDLAFEKKLK